MAPPSQDDIEEHQNFLSDIYRVIEAKLVEEEGIFVASDAELRDLKWSPLAPDADIPSADIISQEWAEDHTHSEFLREQARLNSYAVGTWRALWTANPPDKNLLLDYYKTWSKLDDYCRKATQTWYNIRFKELKEDTAEALDVDPVNFKNIKTSTEWLADELEAAGKNPAFAAQQAVLRAESILSSKAPSRIQSPVIETKTPVILKGITTPKARSISADAIIRSFLSSPYRNVTPTPQILSDITSLEYIDEHIIKQESMSPVQDQQPMSPKDVEMSMVIVNPAPIRHKEYTDLVADPKGKAKEQVMDTTEDFTSKSTSISYHTAPVTLSPKVHQFVKDVTPKNLLEEKFRRSHTPLRVLSNGELLLDFMDIAKKNLSKEDEIQFRKELYEKGYHARSAYLGVLLNGLFTEAVNPELHQGHYHPIKEVYDNFNDLLEKFKDQVESVEKDKTLFAILPYELYGDLLAHWLVTRKYIKQAIDVQSDGSMEKITWSYLNALSAWNTGERRTKQV
ncbi:hypothetical protein AX15_006888 [Amanita polypyramis BW_CC]|nr:hypothetical protein AX15_006888 [Amanita polypyramis BW_CC]